MDKDLNIEDGPIFNWFTLKVMRNEDKCIDHIKEHITMGRLQDKIIDLKCFKETVISESEEFSPESDLLPSRGFKSTKNSIWVRLSNGNYKRIRLVEKKPFGGMIFVKMESNPDLFKLFRTWDPGYSFLGYPFPAPMSDAQFMKTAESLNTEIPNLFEYIKSKNYQIVEGSRSKFKSTDETNTLSRKEEFEEREPEDMFTEPKITSPLTVEQEDSEDDIYSIVPPFNNKTFHIPESGNKGSKELKVNDFVFVKHLGFKGVIQEIDYAKDRVVVGVQMFSRRQPVECKISEVSLI